ncbi:MAG: hypothetical protein KF746_22195 [Chitinophagaceae bacterium]|nr:hypothetical protein [Chitinophagaceae bacterium]
MTKKILFGISVFCSFLLTACLDAEEKIVINKNNSGIYTLTLDMSKLLALMEQMGGAQKDSLKALEKKDTIVYFKPYVDTSAALSAKEKELIREGNLRTKVDEAAKEMKVILSFPFKNVSDLPDLKSTYITAIDKLGVSKKLNKGEESVPGDMPDDLSANKSLLTPAQEAYSFTAAPGKIANTLVNKELFNDKVLQDSSLQMMQQLSVMIGDMNYKTVFVLPGNVKKYKGNNVEVAPDKKTVTFFTTLTDIINRPEAAEYNVEY